METKLYIKYTGLEEFNNTEIDLSLLGESLIGFDKIIKDFIKISEIRCDIEVKATKVEKGSIIIDILLTCFGKNEISTLFLNPEVYIDFLKFVGVYKNEIEGTLKNLNDARLTMNSLVTKYPFDFALFSIFVKIMFNKFRRIKKAGLKNIIETDVPKRYVEGINKIKNKKSYKKALKPFIEDSVSKIEIDSVHSFENPVEINKGNFSDFLTEDERILPDLKNGEKIKVRGKIVGLITDRGDYVKIKIYDFEKKLGSFIALPGGESKTDNFIQFYNKDVNLKLEVFRYSLYQKPKFIIHEINYLQPNLSIMK